jgi:YbbR domain-containing protein
MPRINVPILLLSILLSIFLWFVQFGQDLTVPATIAVKLPTTNVIGLPPKLWVVEVAPFKLQLQGPIDIVRKIENDNDLNNLILVDLTDARPGTYDYPLQFNNQISHLVQGPREIRVKIEEIVTKMVPVRVELRGKLSDANTSLESYPPSENEASITAPKSIADQVVRVRAVLDLHQINPNNPSPQDSILVAVDDRSKTLDATIEPQSVKITPIVVAALVEKTVMISPVIVGTPAPGYLPVATKLNPTSLVITGPTSTLVNMGSVKTEPIDVNGLTSTRWFKVKVTLPRGTKSPLKVINVRYEVAQDPAIARAHQDLTHKLPNGQSVTHP